MASTLKPILKLTKKYITERKPSRRKENDEICKSSIIDNEIMLDAILCIDASRSLINIGHIRDATDFILESLVAIENVREFKGINKKQSQVAIRKLEKSIIYLDDPKTEYKVIDKLSEARNLLVTSTPKRMTDRRKISIMRLVDLRTRWNHKLENDDEIVIRSRKYHDYIYKNSSGRLALCENPRKKNDSTWFFTWVNKAKRIVTLRMSCDREDFLVDGETMFRLVKCGPYVSLQSLEHHKYYVTFVIGVDVLGNLMYTCTRRDDECIHFEFERF